MRCYDLVYYRTTLNATKFLLPCTVMGRAASIFPIRLPHRRLAEKSDTDNMCFPYRIFNGHDHGNDRDFVGGSCAAAFASPRSRAKHEVVGLPQRISTSHVERQNLTLRTQQQHFTRLTNALSKKLENR